MFFQIFEPRIFRVLPDWMNWMKKLFYWITIQSKKPRNSNASHWIQLLDTPLFYLNTAEVLYNIFLIALPKDQTHFNTTISENFISSQGYPHNLVLSFIFHIAQISVLDLAFTLPPITVHCWPKSSSTQGAKNTCCLLLVAITFGIFQQCGSVSILFEFIINPLSSSKIHWYRLWSWQSEM